MSGRTGQSNNVTCSGRVQFLLIATYNYRIVLLLSYNCNKVCTEFRLKFRLCVNCVPRSSIDHSNKIGKIRFAFANIWNAYYIVNTDVISVFCARFLTLPVDFSVQQSRY